MNYEDQPRSSSSGAVIAVVAVVLLLMLAGLLVLGLVGFFFLRVSVAPQIVQPPPAPVVEQRFMTEPVRAVEMPAEGKAAQAVADAPPPSAETRKITVKLDQKGTISADGQTVDLEGLKKLLAAVRADGTVRLEIVVEVDRQCVFEHAAAVQSVCKEAGIENVRVQALTASSD